MLAVSFGSLCPNSLTARVRDTLERAQRAATVLRSLSTSPRHCARRRHEPWTLNAGPRGSGAMRSKPLLSLQEHPLLGEPSLAEAIAPPFHAGPRACGCRWVAHRSATWPARCCPRAFAPARSVSISTPRSGATTPTGRRSCLGRRCGAGGSRVTRRFHGTERPLAPRCTALLADAEARSGRRKPHPHAGASDSSDRSCVGNASAPIDSHSSVRARVDRVPTRRSGSANVR